MSNRAKTVNGYSYWNTTDDFTYYYLVNADLLSNTTAVTMIPNYTGQNISYDFYECHYNTGISDDSALGLYYGDANCMCQLYPYGPEAKNMTLWNYKYTCVIFHNVKLPNGENGSPFAFAACIPFYIINPGGHVVYFYTEYVDYTDVTEAVTNSFQGETTGSSSSVNPTSGSLTVTTPPSSSQTVTTPPSSSINPTITIETVTTPPSATKESNVAITNLVSIIELIILLFVFV